MSDPSGQAVSANALLRTATEALAKAGVEGAGRDARRLLAHALGIEPGRLTLILPDPVSDAVQAGFAALVARRCAREPVSHITGRRAFYGRDFRVTADVLDPRPETEILVAAALSQPFRNVLDLGTGSGCILLTLLAENPVAVGLGADLSQAALAIATRNAASFGLSDRARFLPSDWTAEITGTFDLIVSNPPYIAQAEMAGLEPEVRAWEPRMALTDEADGLSAYRAIMTGAPRLLVPQGRVMVEIGPTQGAAVSALACAAGFVEIEVIPDLDGRDRVVAGVWPGAGG